MKHDFPPLYILRHGETEWNAEGRLQGRYDSPLTALGVTQAKAQHALLATQDLSQFQAYSSPQGRAFHTAALTVLGHISSVTTDVRLKEIGVGQWAGCLRSDIGMPSPSGNPSDALFQYYNKAPEGEGLEALETRCRQFLDHLQGPSVLVTHGVTSRMLRLIVLGLPLSDIATVQGGQGVVYYVANGEQKRLSNSS